MKGEKRAESRTYFANVFLFDPKSMEGKVRRRRKRGKKVSTPLRIDLRNEKERRERENQKDGKTIFFIEEDRFSRK